LPIDNSKKIIYSSETKIQRNSTRLTDICQAPSQYPGSPDNRQDWVQNPSLGSQPSCSGRRSTGRDQRGIVWDLGVSWRIWRDGRVHAV